MNNLFKGEYVHVPSGTTLFKLDSRGSVRSFKHITKPAHLMFLGEDRRSSYYKVFYLGDTYLIDKEHVYKLGEESG